MGQRCPGNREQGTNHQAEVMTSAKGLRQKQGQKSQGEADKQRMSRAVVPDPSLSCHLLTQRGQWLYTQGHFGDGFSLALVTFKVTYLHP